MMGIKCDKLPRAIRKLHIFTHPKQFSSFFFGEKNNSLLDVNSLGDFMIYKRHGRPLKTDEAMGIVFHFPWKDLELVLTRV